MRRKEEPRPGETTRDPSYRHAKLQCSKLNAQRQQFEALQQPLLSPTEARTRLFIEHSY